MEVGERLTKLRTNRKLSQGDIEVKTGLLRCYISRVENGHTVPSVETLEKWAGAFELPLYRLFYDGEVPKKVAARGKPLSEPDVPEMEELRKHLEKMTDHDRQFLLHTATIMARRNRKAA